MKEEVIAKEEGWFIIKEETNKYGNYSLMHEECLPSRRTSPARSIYPALSPARSIYPALYGHEEQTTCFHCEKTPPKRIYTLFRLLNL